MAETAVMRDPQLDTRIKLQPGQRETFRSIFLLNQMLNCGRTFRTSLPYEERFLKETFSFMADQGLVTTSRKGIHYVQMATDKGRKLLKSFLERYQEYLQLYDIFCFVDLTKGEFAFAKYFELSPDDWKLYLKDERWEDLRGAVAEFKKLDPVEIVFMLFISENRFDVTDKEWAYKLAAGDTWEEILRLCNSNLSWRELPEFTDFITGEKVTSEDIMSKIIKKGTELMFELRKEEDRLAQEAQASNDNNAGSGTTTEVVEEVVTEVVVDPYPMTYYNPYLYDPYYISPIWAVPLLLIL